MPSQRPSSPSNYQQQKNSRKEKSVAANNLFTIAGCGLCFFKFQQQWTISSLQRAKTKRKEQFGIEYTTLIGQRKPTVKAGIKRDCLRQAIQDVGAINGLIEQCYDTIDNRQEEVERQVQLNASKHGKKTSIAKEPMKRDKSNKLPKRADRGKDGKRNKKKKKRPMLSKVDLSLTPEEFQGPNVDKWTHCEWNLHEYKTNGGWTNTTVGDVENAVGKSIARAVEKFKAHPKLFIGLFYASEMMSWPEKEQQYTLVYRAGTTGLKPKGVAKRGKVTFMIHQYQPLPSFPNDMMPKQHQDQYTDKMKYRQRTLVTRANKALLPGRGMGLIDDPTLQIIGQVNPSDIAQGQCGNCWLLSGIASLAEFDGAIRRLFRKTAQLDQMPFVDGRPNQYTITLWDLTTWTEVDVVVDERLPIRADGSGQLFGAKPSENGELWVCYLEKALAAHCGGWDQLDGGQCTHAWALLTGCKQQYIIQRAMSNPDKFCCTAKYDPSSGRWADHYNSPSDGPQGMWQVPWPDLGGGGTDNLSEEDLFERMCAWNDSNYLIGAGSTGTSDLNSSDGIVDNHAYSVIDCANNVGDTGIDLILVRNPWGKGEIESGRFRSNGPGWQEYPQIEQELDPTHDGDDGVFWVTKEEFFEHYETVYLGASDLTRFLKDGMKMSRHSRHSRHSRIEKSNHSNHLRLSRHSSHHSTDTESDLAIE
jgi:hypothetical protein